MVFWDVMPCSLVDCYKCFVGTAACTVRVGCYVLVYHLKLWVGTLLLVMLIFYFNPSWQNLYGTHHYILCVYNCSRESLYFSLMYIKILTLHILSLMVSYRSKLLIVSLNMNFMLNCLPCILGPCMLEWRSFYLFICVHSILSSVMQPYQYFICQVHSLFP
jgi:hypothetical protein